MTKRILIIAVLLVGIVGTAIAEKKKLIVVVAKGSPITSISKRDLKHCFLGDPVVIGGKLLAPFNHEAKTAQRTAFDRSILGMNVDEVGRYWVDRKVRGESGAPRSLSVAHVLKVVAKFPNAIGYIAVDQLTPDLQPVKLDGVAHTDAAYNLYAD